ncbi:MAG: ABC-F type ribosomal protection protein, partial [Tumebacillaceae bacterium]
MFALKLNDVKKMYSTRTVFENVTMGIEYGEKVAIVGPNGVGKTTLLKVLTGELRPESGSVAWDKGISVDQIGLLTQQAVWEPQETVYEFVRRSRTGLLSLEKEMREIEVLLSSDVISREINDLMDQYGTLQEQFEAQGGYTYEREIERVLGEVGLPEAVWGTELANASGGQKTRAQLARLLLQEPQVLLLDEPTNHLDAETMDWLEGVIRKFAGTVITVSHDRYFLDQVATRILELSQEGLASYAGNYTAYVEAKELERRQQQLAYDKQQAEMKHLEETIRMFRGWFHSAEANAKGMGAMAPFLKAAAKTHVARMRSKERQLERLQDNKASRPKDVQSIHVKFDTEDRLGNRVFLLEDVAVRFGERELYRDVSVAVERGQRLALVGPNGIGKSTLLKVITGELEPSEGVVKRAPQARIGYFGQEVDRLDPEKTVLQEILDIDGMKQSDARTTLAWFLFRGEDVSKKIGMLSQGEKCRVAFVKLYFSGANVLVLDEPTNYLDIPTRERIENALLNFPGTLLLVSHDRYMVQRLATQLLLFEPGKVAHFAGSLDEWT